MSAGLFRNAMPNPIASSTGKANVQNTASGSRKNSRSRTLDNSRSDEWGLVGDGLLIAKLASGERDEYVLERRGMRRELRHLQPSLGQRGEECRHGAVKFRHAKFVAAVEGANVAHAAERSQHVDRQRAGLTVTEAELHDVLRAERLDQLPRTAQRDDLAVIGARDAIAKNLRFVQVVRRQEGGLSRRLELFDEIPELSPRLRVESRRR